MSDDFHRPTLTFPDGAYNATQVRLYGIRSDIALGVPGKPVTFDDTGISIDSEFDREIDDEQLKKVTEILRGGERDYINKNFKDIINNLIIVIPGFPVQLVFQLKIETKIGTILIAVKNKVTILGQYDFREQMSCGIIVGYSYEGHTYDLPKPKIMLIPVIPEYKIPDDDSGYKLKEAENYAVWIVDKLDECVEFEMNQGFVEQLVLDANLPGKRAPSMYAAKMMMGHRSGRLSE